MAAIAAGNSAEIYVPLSCDMTFTPGAGGTMQLGFAVRSGAAAIAPQTISAATTVSVSAGATVFAQAINAAATYTDPATTDAALQALVSGDRIADAASRDITADDNAKFLAPTGTLTYTIPAGLDPMPSFTVDCPASGTISIAKSGAATLNGAATTLTRTRASNPVGFVVLAHESDAYGVSGA